MIITHLLVFLEAQKYRQCHQATQSNAAAAEEAAATSEELSAQSAILRKTVVSLTEIVEGKNAPN